MHEQQPLNCVFPYVELSEPLRVRSELLFPYKFIDQVQIADAEKARLKEIQKYFYWYINQNIANVTFATSHRTVGEEGIRSRRTPDKVEWPYFDLIRAFLGSLLGLRRVASRLSGS